MIADGPVDRRHAMSVNVAPEAGHAVDVGPPLKVEQVAALAGLVARMNGAREADDFDDYYAANLEFHQKTVE